MNNEVRNTAATKQVQPFQFKSVKELYEAPLEEVSYCVEGFLPASGLSVLAGKPKTGKTTLVRQLAVAVAQGNLFLGRKTQKGSVLYLAMEEKESEVSAHFQALGLSSSDPVGIICGAVPKPQAVAMLEATLKPSENVSLVIIDPLFRFCGVRDSDAYVEVGNALEELLEIARNYNVHVLTAHHMKKKETDDIIDGALGSTAIAGGCDTFIALKADPMGIRTLCSRQRYGKDFEPTRLNWNEQNRELSLGITCDDADRASAAQTEERIHQDMLQYVAEHPDCEQQALINAVRGKRTAKLRTLQLLLDNRLLRQLGGGVKGDPHRYRCEEIAVEV
jgi:archaellum biogenesis ATPase FlaH